MDTSTITATPPYKVTIDEAVSNLVTGMDATGDDASGAEVTIVTGGSAGYVRGGFAVNGNATGNTVIISGGSAGHVWGGFADNGDATGNTVILASGSVGDSVLGGYYLRGRDRMSGNTLIVDKAKNFSVGGNVRFFAALEFTLPSDIANGGTMLKVASEVYLSDATSTSVRIMVAGTGQALKANDTFTLIEAGSLAITPTLTPTAASYFNVEKQGNKLVATALTNLAALPPRTVKGSTSEGGEVTCDYGEVADAIGAATCTATPKPGYNYDAGSMTVSNGTGELISCRKDACTLTGVTTDVTVSATFTLGEYSVSDATPTGAGGTMDCPTTKVTMLDKPTCTANPETGYVFTGASAKYGDSSAASMRCDTDTKECTLSGVRGDVSVTGAFTKGHDITYAITGNGSISCDPNPVPDGDPVTCTAKPDTGSELSAISSSPGIGWSCNPATLECTSTAGVTEPMEVSATFTEIGGNAPTAPQPQQPYVISDTPTMSEVGLLLSGLALAGAAAPALRRRERKGRKQD